MLECKVEELADWMTERHAMYLRRMEGNPKPWTEDKIMQEYRFCNVFRELDTVTIWVKENIRDRWADHPYLWFALCVARRINLPESLDDLGDLLVDWDAYEAEEVLDLRKQAGLQIYNGAYMLTTGSRKVPKNHDTCHNILGELWDKRDFINDELEHADTLEKAFKVFSKGLTGFSGFLAYEVVSDMRYTRYLENAPDAKTWANAGPGATRGLNRIYDRPITKKIKACQANQEMRQLLSDVQFYLPDWFPEIEMREIEHSLCEFDKYQRVKTDKSFLRQKYNGRGE